MLLQEINLCCMIKKLFAVLVGIMISLLLFAETDSIPLNKIKLVAEVQVLKSTHRNYFKGGDLMLNCFTKPQWEFGVGMEYSYTEHHFDNGYHLWRLNFVPTFVDVRFYPLHSNLVRPFLEVAPGISRSWYEKQDDTQVIRKVKERGFYLYTGAAVLFNLKNNFKPFIGIGFKGYRLSTNVYDVNPHGMTFRSGVVF